MPAKDIVELCDERIPERPSNKAIAVHARIRELPQRIVGISNEVRRTDDVVVIREYLATNRALGFAAED